MKTIKTLALFYVIGSSPVANVISFIEGIHARKGTPIKKIKTEFFDNRFADEEMSSELIFEDVEKKALDLGFVEVPFCVAEILEKGYYFEGFDKIKPYASAEFIEAVESWAKSEGMF